MDKPDLVSGFKHDADPPPVPTITLHELLWEQVYKPGLRNLRDDVEKLLSENGLYTIPSIRSEATTRDSNTQENAYIDFEGPSLYGSKPHPAAPHDGDGHHTRPR
jgi:hypothetical protein